jgi:hypothetical protein
MKPRILPAGLTAFFASLLAAGGLAPGAHAVNSINLQTFNPSTSDHFVLLEDGFRSEWPKVARFYAGANYNYFTEPLVVMNAAQTLKLYNIVDSISTADFFMGIRLSNNFALFAGLPVHSVRFSSEALLKAAQSNPPLQQSQTVMGDFRILGKVRLTDDESNTSIALIPEIHLPTGASGALVSDASTYMALRAALERVFESWTMLFNVGYASAGNSTYTWGADTFTTLDYRRRLLLGFGGFMPFNDSWGMNIELNTINMIPLDVNVAPNDFYAGLRYGSSGGFAMTGGFSIGRLGGQLGQDFRVIAGIRYTLLEDDVAAPAAPVKSTAPAAPVPAKPATPATPATAPQLTPQVKKR